LAGAIRPDVDAEPDRRREGEGEDQDRQDRVLESRAIEHGKQHRTEPEDTERQHHHDRVASSTSSSSSSCSSPVCGLPSLPGSGSGASAAWSSSTACSSSAWESSRMSTEECATYTR